MKSDLSRFEKQQYLNIETFRKNGQGVKTPVWFVQDGDTLRIWTQADSGKAKRIHADGNVRLVPSTASGEAIGEWTSAHASILDTTDEINKTVSMLRKKYGFSFNFFAYIGRMRKAKYVTIKVDLA
jgi:uncharacterized protein